MTRGGGAEGASLGPAEKPPRHIPVLRSEVLGTLAPTDGEIYIDGTFGAGGYTRAILEAAECQVLALDRDPNAIHGAASLQAEFGKRLTLVESPFSRLDEVARESLGGAQVDGRAVHADARTRRCGVPRFSRPQDRRTASGDADVSGITDFHQ